jgi:hypothetical protein
MLDEVIEVKVLLLKGTNNASFCQGINCPCGREEKLQLSTYLQSRYQNRLIYVHPPMSYEKEIL